MFSQEDLLKLAASFLAGGISTFVLFNYIFPNNKTEKVTKPDSCDFVNHTVEKSQSKVVTSIDIEDLPNKVAYCRCWKSSTILRLPFYNGVVKTIKDMQDRQPDSLFIFIAFFLFPYCDGTHNAHNKLTGDNVGPLILQKKVPSD